MWIYLWPSLSLPSFFMCKCRLSRGLTKELSYRTFKSTADPKAVKRGIMDWAEKEKKERGNLI
jgi:hypothetical protein